MGRAVSCGLRGRGEPARRLSSMVFLANAEFEVFGRSFTALYTCSCDHSCTRGRSPLALRQFWFVRELFCAGARGRRGAGARGGRGAYFTGRGPTACVCRFAKKYRARRVTYNSWQAKDPGRITRSQLQHTHRSNTTHVTLSTRCSARTHNARPMGYF